MIRTKSPWYLISTRCLFIKAILATQFDAFEKGRWHLYNVWKNLQYAKFLGPTSQFQFKSLLGEGIFNSDGMPPFLLALYLSDWSWLIRWNVEVSTHYRYPKTCNLDSNSKLQGSTAQWLVHFSPESVLATSISTRKIAPAHCSSPELDWRRAFPLNSRYIQLFLGQIWSSRFHPRTWLLGSL